jgi:hypothetical protein
MGAGRLSSRSRDGDRDHARPAAACDDLSFFSRNVCLHAHLFVTQASRTHSLTTSMMVEDSFGREDDGSGAEGGVGAGGNGGGTGGGNTAVRSLCRRLR